MLYPLVANKIEQLDIDPLKAVEGYVWYNRAEGVYKCYINNEINIFITDLVFVNNIQPLINAAVSQHEYTVSFENSNKIIIKHNKGKINFSYTVFDDDEQCTLACSMKLIDENELHIDFMDPVTGRIYMYFE